MVSFPGDLTATKYPGYFWDTKNKVLYSIKISGVLTPLKRRDVRSLYRFVPGIHWLDCDNWLYQVSVAGRKKYLTDKYLNALTLEDSVVPTKDTQNVVSA